MRAKKPCGALCIIENSSSSFEVIVVVARLTMHLFEHRYYRLGKNLMSLVGQWPYQSTRAKRGFRAVLILPTIYQIVCEILAIVKYRDDWNMLVECILPIVFGAICTTKYIDFLWNSQTTLTLLNRIRTDWQVWARHREVKILHEYAEWGQKITTVYTAALYVTMFFYVTQPMMTKLIDIVLKNDTEPGTFPYPVVYYRLDEQKYYFYLSIYCSVLALIVLTVVVSSDVMLIVYAQHVCGIFSAVGHKLKRIGCNDRSVEMDMEYLASCIDRHNDAIEYADLIKSSYAWSFFFILGFGMILLNASALQILLNTGDLASAAKFALLILGALFYFYVECYISQIVIDHSISIRFYIHSSKWYRLPPKAQKLLQFMTMRCNEPCQLMVGNILTMSLQSFGTVLRTFMSYFACARSMRGL